MGDLEREISMQLVKELLYWAKMAEDINYFIPKLPTGIKIKNAASTLKHI